VHRVVAREGHPRRGSAVDRVPQRAAGRLLRRREQGEGHRRGGGRPLVKGAKAAKASKDKKDKKDKKAKRTSSKATKAKAKANGRSHGKR